MSSIKVVIEDSTISGTNYQAQSSEPLTSLEASSKAMPVNNTSVNNTAKMKGIAIAAMVGQRSLSYLTSNVGKYTGDSRKQTMVNNITEGVSLAALAYVNPYIAVASVGIKIATTIADENYKRTWNEREVNNARAKAGYSSANEITGRRH